MTTLSFTVPPSAEGSRLGVFLRTQGVSASCIKAVKHQGEGFYADGRPLHTDQPVHAGQRITFALAPEPPTTVTPQPVPFRILREDAFAAVVEKPAGIAVHPHPQPSGRNPGQRVAVPPAAAGQDRRFPPGQPDRQKHQRAGAAGAKFLCGPRPGGACDKVLPGAGRRVHRAADSADRRPHRPARGFHHRPLRPAGRKTQPHPAPGPGLRGRPHPAGLPACHRPHTPDPGPYIPPRAPAGRRYAVRRAPPT